MTGTLLKKNETLQKIDYCGLATDASNEDYAKAQNACGLCVGDNVMVVRRAHAGERGWADSWIPDMDERLFDRGTVPALDPVRGVRVEFLAPDNPLTGSVAWNFPFFALAKIVKTE